MHRSKMKKSRRFSAGLCFSFYLRLNHVDLFCKNHSSQDVSCGSNDFQSVLGDINFRLHDFSRMPDSKRLLLTAINLCR